MRRLEQQRFTILEVAVAADWHELMVPRRGMQPSNACEAAIADKWTRGAARQRLADKVRAQ